MADILSNDFNNNQRIRALALYRMKILAALILSGVFIGLCLSIYLGGMGIWGWTQSFFESATVGALADWFAVVALFRHPFGIPLPHTAIIPKSKSKLANQLSLFVRDNFLDPQTLLSKLSIFNPSEKLARWLSSPEKVKSGVNILRGWMLQGLGLFDDNKLQQTLDLALNDVLINWNASKHFGQFLSFITENDRHLELLDKILYQLGELLGKEEIRDRLSILFLSTLKKEWPLIIGTANAVKLGPWLSNKLVTHIPKLIQKIQEMLQDPEDESHLILITHIQNLITRLEQDQELANKINNIKLEIIASREFQIFIKSAGNDFLNRLKHELETTDSKFIYNAERLLHRLGEKLDYDFDLKNSINSQILELAEKLVHDLGDIITKHISDTITQWNEKNMVREIELSVGKDLQFIRFNGTLIGGLAGLSLHGLQWLVPTIH